MTEQRDVTIKTAQDDGGSVTPGDILAPVGIGAAATGTYLGSKALDRRLTEAGLATKMPGAKGSDVIRFARSVFNPSADSVRRYAETSSNFLNRDISKGVSGLGLLRVFGNALWRAGVDMKKAHPKLAKMLRAKGAHFRHDAGHPHFNGFPTPGAGVRTLIGEKANWGGLSLENMGHIARESLEGSGWKADRKAVKVFDRKFRDLILQGYNFRPFRYSRKDIQPILAEIVRMHGPGTDAQAIARSLMPGADITKSLHEAVKPVFTNSLTSHEEVANLSRSLAGRLSLMAAAGTSRRGAIQHGGELALLNMIKILRNPKFRGGVVAAGTAGVGSLIYNAIKRKKNGS